MSTILTKVTDIVAQHVDRRDGWFVVDGGDGQTVSLRDLLPEGSHGRRGNWVFSCAFKPVEQEQE